MATVTFQPVEQTASYTASAQTATVTRFDLGSMTFTPSRFDGTVRTFTASPYAFTVDLTTGANDYTPPVGGAAVFDTAVFDTDIYS